jgi:hypothetical protein
MFYDNISEALLWGTLRSQLQNRNKRSCMWIFYVEDLLLQEIDQNFLSWYWIVLEVSYSKYKIWLVIDKIASFTQAGELGFELELLVFCSYFLIRSKL